LSPLQIRRGRTSVGSSEVENIDTPLGTCFEQEFVEIERSGHSSLSEILQAHGHCRKPLISPISRQFGGGRTGKYNHDGDTIREFERSEVREMWYFERRKLRSLFDEDSEA
jgi:hypothetical protein